MLIQSVAYSGEIYRALRSYAPLEGQNHMNRCKHFDEVSEEGYKGCGVFSVLWVVPGWLTFKIMTGDTKGFRDPPTGREHATQGHKA